MESQFNFFYRQDWIDDIKKIRDKLDETSSASDMEICSEGPSNISAFDQDPGLGVTPRRGSSRKIVSSAELREYILKFKNSEKSYLNYLSVYSNSAKKFCFLI